MNDMITLMVKIEMPVPNAPSKFKELARNSFEIDDNLTYDYQKLIDGIRLMYPQHKCLVINLTAVCHGDYARNKK